jgi:hypothetical protein
MQPEDAPHRRAPAGSAHERFSKISIARFAVGLSNGRDADRREGERGQQSPREPKVHVMHILTNHPDAALQVAHATITQRVNEAQVRAWTRSLRTSRNTDRRAQPTR